jgi:hypothetical protein
MSKATDLILKICRLPPAIREDDGIGEPIGEPRLPIVWVDGRDLAAQDERLITLVEAVWFQRDQPAFASSYAKHMAWGQAWTEFRHAHPLLLRHDAETVLTGMLGKLQSIQNAEDEVMTDGWTMALVKLVENELTALLEKEGTPFKEFSTYHLGLGRTLVGLTHLLVDGDIRSDQAKILLRAAVDALPGSVLEDLIDQHEEIFNEVEGDALETLMDEVIAANQKAVDEIKAGKDKAIGFLVGQILKQHKVDPGVVKERLFTKIRGT